MRFDFLVSSARKTPALARSLHLAGVAEAWPEVVSLAQEMEAAGGSILVRDASGRTVIHVGVEERQPQLILRDLGVAPAEAAA